MRYYEHSSRKAIWSQRIALLAFAIFIGAFVWHRFFHAPTPVALKIFGGALAASVMALALGGVALVNIWNEGYLGAGRASLGIFVSMLVLAVPLWSLPSLLTLPRLYDVTTDTAAPPAFDRLARMRQGQANPPRYQYNFAPLQAAAYPDIQTMTLPRPLPEVYSAVREVVKALNWRVWDEQAPELTKAGRIEAEDRTLIFGFSDDVVVRVTGSARESKIDVRSSSRYGQHDLGRNAQRIRRFLSDVRTRLAQLEQGERIEQATRQANDKVRQPAAKGKGL